MIHIENICKRFGTLEVLRGISLDVADGEVVAIVGASGAGKTTLLQIIGTLSRPDEGSVLISKRNVFALDDCALSRFRNEQIGFVFPVPPLAARVHGFRERSAFPASSGVVRGLRSKAVRANCLT